MKDIFSLSKEKVDSIVISEIAIKKSSAPLSSLLDRISVVDKHQGYSIYKVLGANITFMNFQEENFPFEPYFGQLNRVFIANLDTNARLKICEAPKSINRDAPKNHPIHYAAFDPKYRQWLSESFKKAFDVEVIPNILNGETIPLCMGEAVSLEGDYKDEQSRQEDYYEILKTYKKIQEQGDGIKSFTGILLYLMLDYYCTYLIDEPESFLHPPQAYIMGQIIGNTLSNQQQAFISTHSEEIIKGLMEICPNRIKVIRITRQEDLNYFAILENEKFSEIWNDPLLKHSNIMLSLFHKSVVLCESDSDCKMYSIIESYLKQKHGKYSEALFIHCGGKNRMAKIAAALRALNIDVKLILDIDVLDDKTIFKGIIEAFNINWSSIERYYNIIVSNLHSPKEKIKRETTRTMINELLNKSKSEELSSNEIKDIQSLISTSSKWEILKKTGVSALPAGDATSAYKEMDKILRSNCIYIVPVGELECFIKDVGGHGPTWANNVLEKYPDLNNDIYNEIKKFLEGMRI